MKAKQWIKDYVDFAMPLVMAIVALNLVDLLIDLPYAYKPERYIPKISDFFTIKAHLNVFMQQVDGYAILVSSSIVLILALLIRLFTNRIFLTFKTPIYVVYFIYGMFYLVASFVDENLMVVFILIDILVVGGFYLYSFYYLKIFFANFPIIKKISYIAIAILYLLLLLLTYMKYYFIVNVTDNSIYAQLLIYLTEKPNILLITKYIILIYTLSLVVVSILSYFILSVLKKDTFIIPYDIKEFIFECKVELEAQREAEAERRERNRIINDIADAVRKRL